MRIIISGGGTGGHIFPALSIAEAMKRHDPDCEILFVGAEGKMEMEKVPAAGYKITGLPVAGLKRALSLSNLSLPFKIAKSLRMAGKIIREFNPDVVIGVGGYASAPVLWKAQSMGIATLIQEQNSYAGLTNRILGKKASRICVAYEGMNRFFPSGKIILTGNPIRQSIRRPTIQDREEAFRFYGIKPQDKCIFVVGGSLGCATLNNAMKRWICEGTPSSEGIHVIWQCGKYYKNGIDEFMNMHPCDTVRHYDFITRMDLAYAAADLIISRSGAGTISELCVAGVPAIFVPSPNVTEDHQTHNAMALVNKGAAELVPDAQACESLMAKATALVRNASRLESLKDNMLKLAKADAADVIAGEIIKLAQKTE